MIRWMCVGAAVVGLMACGGKGGGGAATADELGKTMMATLNSGDAAALKALFPTKALVDSALKCEDGKGPWQKIEKESAKFVEEATSELKGVTFEWLGIDAEGDKSKALKKGEAKDGCTALADVAIAKTRFKFKMTKDGKSEEESEGVNLIQLGGSWYLMDM